MEDVKALDPKLVQRANASSNAFLFGDSISEKYEANISEIGKMLHLDEQRKGKTMETIFNLRTIELFARGNAVGPGVSGPAVYDKERVMKNLDSAGLAVANADAYMRKLRQDEEKAKIAQRHDSLAKAIQEADKEGLKEITVDGKAYFKANKNWTTKKPNQVRR